MKARGAVIVLAVAIAAGVALWAFKLRGDGGTPATPKVTQGSGAATPSSTTVAAKPAAKARATITVTDAKGPIADATVLLVPRDREPLSLRTGADGIARADQLEPGAYEISASATGHEPAFLAAELVADQDKAVPLTLVIGGRALTGLVTDASGGPVTGVRIDARRLGSNGFPELATASTLTGADGKYALTVAEGHHTVAASSPDYAPQARTVEVGEAGATADFALVPGGVIEGFVRDERTRDPIAGAVVEARRDGGGGGMGFGGGGVRRAIAGPDGRFRVTGLRPGSYEVEASAEIGYTRAPTVIGLGVAEQITDVELLVGKGPTIAGTVVDETDAPVPNVEVEAFGRGAGGIEAKADAKGAFVISGLAPGSYMLMGRGEAYIPTMALPVELADKDVTGVVVRVQRGLRITGHVEPRQPCAIDVSETDDENLHMMAVLSGAGGQTTGPDGVFHVGPTTPRKVELAARCPSGDRGTLVVTIAAGMPEIVLAVKPGASIAGRVLDGKGRPVPGVTVMASPQSGAMRTTIVNGMVTSGVQALTGAQGTYRLVGLPAGPHGLQVLDRGRPVPMRNPVSLTLGATDKTGVDLTVELPNGTIEGVVTGPDGKPLADAWVSVRQDFRSMLENLTAPPGPPPGPGEARESRTVTVSMDDDDGGSTSELPPVLTDVQGRFVMRGLPHATYEVLAEAQAGALRGRVPDIKPDAKVTIQALGVSSLSGTVKGPSGPAALFTVELDGPTSTTRSFTGGTFKLGRVDPGDYTVRVTSSVGHGEAKVKVSPNQPASVDIALASNAIVVGKLVDKQGQPIAGLGVLLIPDTGDGRTKISMEGMPPVSGSDGAFRLEAKGGTMHLVVLSQPSPTFRRGLELAPGTTIDVGTITVDPAAPP